MRQQVYIVSSEGPDDFVSVREEGHLICYKNGRCCYEIKTDSESISGFAYRCEELYLTMKESSSCFIKRRKKQTWEEVVFQEYRCIRLLKLVSDHEDILVFEGRKGDEGNGTVFI